MDKGALRMRTQAQTHSKKKNFNVSQQIFLAVQENREAEVILICDIFVNHF